MALIIVIKHFNLFW